MSSVLAGILRPQELSAPRPPEERGRGRESVRLMVSTATEDRDHAFVEIPDLLAPGDLLVVNESATLAASLPASGRLGGFRLNLSNHYGAGLWVAEPRWDHARPGPLPLEVGDRFEAAGLPARVIARFPGIARLLFVRLEGDVQAAMTARGEPIHYGYVDRSYDLEAYQTIFSRVPGSAEMPSAGRPFTGEILRAVREGGIEVRPITLHTGVSSLEGTDFAPGLSPVFPEAFEIPTATAAAVDRAHREHRRVIAIGTTVLRALESATVNGTVRPMTGFTRAYLHPGRSLSVADGLLTGFHDAGTSHLELLSAFMGIPRLRRGYQRALDHRYLWHEFGDVHLIWGR
jgi:S-adenosylmethionine:tRNA ribosyltransferase-isomerase